MRIDIVEECPGWREPDSDCQSSTKRLYESTVFVICPQCAQVRNLPPLPAGPLQRRFEVAVRIRLPHLTHPRSCSYNRSFDYGNGFHSSFNRRSDWPPWRGRTRKSIPRSRESRSNSSANSEGGQDGTASGFFCHGTFRSILQLQPMNLATLPPTTPVMADDDSFRDERHQI